ncbi:MAG TPA: DUF4097 family beta strand repeat-containing protein [Vicinamibacteria bacterium]|nr:DUF4097 family beta strand repeat-containing protein [Vicinamibacteria bacterium]
MRLNPSSVTLACLALILGLAVPASAEVTRTVHAELTPAEAAHFNIENLAGSIRVSAGPGESVTVVATVHAESDSLADSLRFERRTWRGGEPVLRLSWPVDQHRSFRFPAAPAESEIRYADDGSTDGWDGGRHRVRVSRDEGVLLWAELDVRVPRRALEAGFYNRAGGVTASGVQGTLRFDTAAGAIDVDHVSGDVLADSGSGDVTAADVEGSFRCDTGSGTCDVRGFRGDRLSLDSGSGRLRLVDVQARVVDADTGSGDVEAELRSAARVRADTGSGDVRLRLPRDASFELRADTGSGDVKSRFSDAEPIVRRREVIGYRRGDGDVKIDVDTGSGDVTVEPLG